MKEAVAGKWRLFSNLIKWLRMWAADADMRELERCGDDMRRIAADVGVSTDDLRRLVPRGASAAALLPHMMASLNLDPASIPVDVLRDLQRVCSLCKNKTECACELAKGNADSTYPAFCPNADTLCALQLEMQRWPAQFDHLPIDRHKVSRFSAGVGDGKGPAAGC